MSSQEVSQELFRASDYAQDHKKHLLVCASGSVASIKILQIVDALSKHPSISIRILLTASASNFLASQSHEQPHLSSLLTYPNVDGIHYDSDEWAEPWKRGDAILHIELRRWADIMVISPLSANTLAKIVGGWADNLLTSVVRAWDTEGVLNDGRDMDGHGEEGTIDGGEGRRKKRKRIIVAPAMNTAMFRHPITKRQIAVLEEEWGVGRENGKDEGWFEVLLPQERELACGLEGAMRDWVEIVKVIEERLGLGTSRGDEKWLKDV